jgi:hypothetical protein
MVLAEGCQPLPHQPYRQAVLHEKETGGSDAKHHQRMAIEPVLQPTPA